MEPTEIFGGPEECQSSESGWTMYIGDTADDGTHASETDDSMASDASSGPSHHGRFRSKHGEDKEDGRHCYSDKKAKKPSVGKQDKEEKQEMSCKTKESSTRSPSGSTARINMGFGKRK
ncbi:hypothetical protein V6N13_125269 [Hibiscus sabdariffa]|uniref:Uncharacterized protein n=1 Tax=Hibiscus sabdariffa TaxID=183260 RepID=A0ABR2U5G9_9ROSI